MLFGNLHDKMYLFSRSFKLLFNGGGRALHAEQARRHSLKPFLKEGFKNPKNFKKIIFDNAFLKVFGVLRTFFQKGSKPPEAVPRQPDKPKFED